jgi:predicted small integral membrane protein
MSTWTYRILMALLAANLVLALYMAWTYHPPAPQCLNGIVMVPNKTGDMWVQKGLWATHCMPVDRD